ncbi:MAG: hypothetical protein RR232_07905 [Clostridia bacterium]
MKKIFGTILLALEIAVATGMTIIGLFDVKINFINDTRMAVIVLGVLGMLFCIPGVIRFIKRAPMHILSLVGYLLGAMAMLIFFAQLFMLKIPVIGNPKLALVILAAIIVLKGVIGRNLPPTKEEMKKAKAKAKQDDTDFPANV